MSGLPTHMRSAPSAITRSSSSGTAAVSERGEKKLDVIDTPADRQAAQLGFDEKGIFDVENDGVRRKVKVVIEQKTGKELVQDISTGEYTVPRW